MTIPFFTKRSMRFLFDHYFEITMLALILFFSFIICQEALTRIFDFDEFQVMFASNAMLEGKDLYRHHGGQHFPLANILVSFLIKIIGKEAYTILVVRQFMVLMLLTTVFFLYKAAVLIIDSKTGLLAAALTLSSVAFIDKGIEIRHDVFNMTFNTIGAYWALRSVEEKRMTHVWISGLFVGMAAASTQKAVIWIAGIVFGVLYPRIRNKDIKQAVNIITIYAVSIVLVLSLAIVYQVLTTDGSLDAFWRGPVRIGLVHLRNEAVNTTYPFLFTRIHMISVLLSQNGPFYLLSVLATLWGFGCMLRGDEKTGIVTLWAFFGLSFYLVCHRPFFQTFLPTVPALALIFSIGAQRLKFEKFSSSFRNLVVVNGIMIGVLFVYPSTIIARPESRNPRNTKQMETIAFCLNNLKPDDRVFSFTQQQMFFDTVLHLWDRSCGKSLYTLDPDCVRGLLIKNQCKIVINDIRTRVMKDNVRRLVYENYFPPGIGEVLVPGFGIPPGGVGKKTILISGGYFLSSTGIWIDGKQPEGKIVYLKQRSYRFRNGSDRPVFFLYMFEKGRSPMK